MLFHCRERQKAHSHFKNLLGKVSIKRILDPTKKLNIGSVGSVGSSGNVKFINLQFNKMVTY